MEDQLVTVETYQFLPQAQAAKLQLEGNDIQVFLADAETVNMDWLLGNAIGNIKLQVPRDQVDKAIAVLEEMRDKARRRQDEENEDTDEAVCLRCGAELPKNETRCRKCGWSYLAEENGATGITRHLIGHDLSAGEEKPLRTSLLRIMKEPFFWLYLTLALLVAFLLLSAGFNWLLKARG
jgi:ribosomal protein L40E